MHFCDGQAAPCIISVHGCMAWCLALGGLPYLFWGPWSCDVINGWLPHEMDFDIEKVKSKNKHFVLLDIVHIGDMSSSSSLLPHTSSFDLWDKAGCTGRLEAEGDQVEIEPLWKKCKDCSNFKQCFELFFQTKIHYYFHVTSSCSFTQGKFLTIYIFFD